MGGRHWRSGSRGTAAAARCSLHLPTTGQRWASATPNIVIMPHSRIARRNTPARHSSSARRKSDLYLTAARRPVFCPNPYITFCLQPFSLLLPKETQILRQLSFIYARPTPFFSSSGPKLFDRTDRFGIFEAMSYAEVYSQSQHGNFRYLTKFSGLEVFLLSFVSC